MKKLQLNKFRRYFAFANRREYVLIQDGCEYDTVVDWDRLGLDGVARHHAPTCLEEAGYPDERTLVVETVVCLVRFGAGKRFKRRHCLETGSVLTTLEPDEPPCSETAHDWELAEHTTGHRWYECAHCGAERTERDNVCGNTGRQYDETVYRRSPRFGRYDVNRDYGR